MPAKVIFGRTAQANFESFSVSESEIGAIAKYLSEFPQSGRSLVKKYPSLRVLNWMEGKFNIVFIFLPMSDFSNFVEDIVYITAVVDRVSTNSSPPDPEALSQLVQAVISLVQAAFT